MVELALTSLLLQKAKRDGHYTGYNHLKQNILQEELRALLEDGTTQSSSLPLKHCPKYISAITTKILCKNIVSNLPTLSARKFIE